MIKAGVNFLTDAPVPRLVELAQEAERLGFSKCWIFDEGLEGRDVFVTLGAIAQNTKTLQIGTGITNPYTRHPAQTANAIATVDEISGGRAFLGLGAGGTLVLEPMGLTRSKPLTALREILETIRPLFRGEKVNYQGNFIRLNEAHIHFARPDLPIWIASRGEKILTLAGKAADGVTLDFLHRDLMQNYVDWIMAGAAMSGNKPQLCYTAMIITNEHILQKMRPYMTFPIVDSPPAAKDLIGISPAEVNEIRQTMFREGLAQAGKLLKEEWIRPFVIMGSPEECARDLKDMSARFGTDEISVVNMDLDVAPELMRQVADVLALL